MRTVVLINSLLILRRKKKKKSLSESQGACSNCHPQLDWRCSDTTCINNTQVCDGKEDCSDGGDEQLCNFICYNMETIAMEVSSCC